MGMQPLFDNTDMENIIHYYKEMVYGIALTRVRNRSDADDVFQEVFLAYHRRQPVIREEEHRKAWLIKATINCSKKMVSRHKNTIPIDELTDICIEYQTDEDYDLYEALCSLPEKYRITLHLYYFEDLSVRDIANILKIRLGSVRMRMLRGREMLRELLHDELD